MRLLGAMLLYGVMFTGAALLAIGGAMLIGYGFAFGEPWKIGAGALSLAVLAWWAYRANAGSGSVGI
jgi:hypothetical protein